MRGQEVPCSSYQGSRADGPLANGLSDQCQIYDKRLLYCSLLFNTDVFKGCTKFSLKPFYLKQNEDKWCLRFPSPVDIGKLYQQQASF